MMMMKSAVIEIYYFTRGVYTKFPAY